MNKTVSQQRLLILQPKSTGFITNSIFLSHYRPKHS